jgi:hypothetical protein
MAWAGVVPGLESPFSTMGSHSALTDGMINGYFGLSSEQLEPMAAAAEEQVRGNSASSEASIKAAKKYSCVLCDLYYLKMKR